MTGLALLALGSAALAQSPAGPEPKETVLETFDLGRPDADWQFQPGARFAFEEAVGDAPAHWRFERDGTGLLGRGALEALWKEHGDEPDFYERHFRPRALELFEGRNQ